MKLSGFEEKVRDLFLIGVYTGLRFSDYSKLIDMKIVTSPEGYKTITLEQEKTEDVVVIPVDVRLESILKKYKNNVPKVESQNLNRTIKVICRRLSRKVPSLAKKIPTRLTKKELDAEKKGKVVFEKCDDGRYLKPKWSMISSHTGRRTCCTLMSQAKKLSEEEMMSISGHHDSRTFRQYVKTSKTEMAEGIYKSCGGKLF
jgi:integrase